MTMTHRVLIETGILIILGGIIFVTLLMVDKAKPKVIPFLIDKLS